MPLTEAVVNAELDDIFQGVYISLHSGDPGGSGANEIVGGSYIRQLESFNPAAGRALTNGVNIVFTVMPACTVRYIGFWTLQVGGTFKGGYATPETAVLATQSLVIEAGDLDLSWAG